MNLAEKASLKRVESTAALQRTMRRLLVRMVTYEGGELVRRRVPESELTYGDEEEDERVQAVLAKLLSARLIVRGLESEGDPFVEPAHDALVRGWDKLLEWSQEDQEQLQLRRLLTPAANDWEHRQGGTWHTSPRLSLLNRIRQSEDSWLNLNEREFIERSVATKKSILLVASVLVVAAFVVLTTLTYFARENASRASAEADRNKSMQLAAQCQRELAIGDSSEALEYALASREAAATVESNTVLRAVLRSALPEAILKHPGAQVGPRISPSGQRAIRLMQGPVLDAQVSPLGTWLVTGCSDSTARVWRTDNWEEIGMFRQHRGPVFEVEFLSEDIVATASDDGTVIVWRINSGEVIQGYVVRDGPTYLIALTGESRDWLLFSGGEQVHLVNPMSKEEMTLSGHQVPISVVKYKARQNRILTGGIDGTAMIWNGTSGQLLASIKVSESEILDLDLDSESRQLLTATYAGEIKLWELESKRELLEFDGHSERIDRAQFRTTLLEVRAQKGENAYLDSTIEDYSQIMSRVSLPLQYRIKELVISTDRSGKMCVWDGENGRLLDRDVPNRDAGLLEVDMFNELISNSGRIGLGRHLSEVTGYATQRFTMGYESTIVGGSDGVLRVLQINKGGIRHDRVLRSHQSTIVDVKIQEESRESSWNNQTEAKLFDSGNIVVSTSLDGAVRVWKDWNASIAAGDEHSILVNGGAFTGAITPNRDLILVGTSGAILYNSNVFNDDCDSHLRERTLVENYAKNVVVSPNSKFVLLITGDEAELRNTKNYELLATLKGHAETIGTAEFSADSSKIVTSSGDGIAIIWSTNEGEALFRLIGHEKAEGIGGMVADDVRHATFSPDGEHVVMSG